MYIDFKLKDEKKRKRLKGWPETFAKQHPILGTFLVVISYPIVFPIMLLLLGIGSFLSFRTGQTRIIYKCQKCGKFLGTPFAYGKKSFELLALDETCPHCGNVNQVTLQCEMEEQEKLYREAINDESERSAGFWLRLEEMSRIEVSHEIYKMLVNGISIPHESINTKPPLQSKELDFYSKLTYSISNSIFRLANKEPNEGQLELMKNKIIKVLQKNNVQTESMETTIFKIMDLVNSRLPYEHLKKRTNS